MFQGFFATEFCCQPVTLEKDICLSGLTRWLIPSLEAPHFYLQNPFSVTRFTLSEYFLYVKVSGFKFARTLDIKSFNDLKCLKRVTWGERVVGFNTIPFKRSIKHFLLWGNSCELRSVCGFVWIHLHSVSRWEWALTDGNNFPIGSWHLTCHRLTQT